jgi:hypothetical protein
MVKRTSKEQLESIFGRENSKSSKNLLAVSELKKSKSKSHGGRLGSASKSQSNLKISSEA